MPQKTVQEIMNMTISPGAVVYGQKAVTTAGTQVVLGTTASIPSGVVSIRALAGNTGVIYVGGAAVSSADGYQLNAKDEVLWPATDIANVWIDSAANGDGVSFWYV